MDQIKNKKLEIVKKIFLGIAMGITAMLVFVAGWLCVDKFVYKSAIPSFMGYSSLTVATGSMSGTIEQGDFIIIKDTGDYKIGDIVTYLHEGEKIPTTHRIIQIEEDGRFVTKGDFNDSEDLQRVEKSEILGEVVSVWHNFGIFIGWLLDGGGFIYVLALLLIIILFVYILKKPKMALVVPKEEVDDVNKIGDKQETDNQERQDKDESHIDIVVVDVEEIEEPKQEEVKNIELNQENIEAVKKIQPKVEKKEVKKEKETITKAQEKRISKPKTETKKQASKKAIEKVEVKKEEQVLPENKVIENKAEEVKVEKKTPVKKTTTKSTTKTAEIKAETKAKPKTVKASDKEMEKEPKKTAGTKKTIKKTSKATTSKKKTEKKEKTKEDELNERFNKLLDSPLVQQLSSQAEQEKKVAVSQGVESPKLDFIDNKDINVATPYYEENPKRVDEHSKPLVDQTKNLDDRDKIVKR